jgi:hypothetical protein
METCVSLLKLNGNFQWNHRWSAVSRSWGVCKFLVFFIKKINKNYGGLLDSRRVAKSMIRIDNNERQKLSFSKIID